MSTERCLEYKDWTDDVYVEYGIPARLHAGLTRYLKHHIEPGGYLLAVLSNDLSGAMLRWAGPEPNPAESIVRFLCAECPAPCHGSPGLVRAWFAITQS